MIIAGTGHRTLGSYTIPNKVYNYVHKETERLLVELKPDTVISGLAIGFDTLLADVSLKLKIPLLCAVPFIGQEKIWPMYAQIKYHNILKQAAEVKIVSEGGYSASKMQIRNCWMTNHCDKLLACFDGSNGGTANCVAYAKSIKREIIIIDPKKAK
jgi:uncharacterized phage-like protein YoqJ